MALTPAPKAALPPSLEDMEAMAAEAFAALPPWVRRACGPLRVVVEDFADDATLDDLGIEDAYELTGLYDGVALTDRSADDLPTGPDTVRLYRRPILEEWIDRADIPLPSLVAHILVHEIAHHFGWSDERIAEIDRWWE